MKIYEVLSQKANSMYDVVDSYQSLLDLVTK